MIVRVFLILVCISAFIIKSGAQTNWQKVTFEFNNEHIIEKNDSVIKFQYAYKTLPQIEDKWYHWFDTIIHKTRGGYTAKLLDGYYIQYDKLGNLCLQGQFLDGLKNWTWKYWYPNGQIKAIENWKAGEKNGVFTKYTVDGKLISSIEFKKNVLYGESVYYRADTVYQIKKYKKGKDISK